MREGHASSIPQAFRRFLQRNAHAYVAASKFPASETIRIIREAGGLAVLAHPTTIDKNLKGVPVKKLSESGLAGLEVFYPGHSLVICRRLLDICKHGHLIATGQ